MPISRAFSTYPPESPASEPSFQLRNSVVYVRLLLANPTQSSVNNIGSYHVDIWRELVRRELYIEF